MAILQLSADNPQGRSVEIDRPSWEDVEAAIRRLDGIRYSEVALSDGDSTGLLIVGGYENRYMCERMYNDINALLLDPTKSRDKQVPVVAYEYGETEDSPEYWTVSLEMTLKAAHFFFLTNTLDPDLTWWER